jgi:hypothetical protein
VATIGTTTVFGSAGVFAETAIAGLPRGAVTGGVIHTTGEAPRQAQADVFIAYTALGGLAVTADLPGQDLAPAQLAGTLTTASASVAALDNNRISNNVSLQDFGSGRPDFGGDGFSGAPTGAVVPEPGTLTQLGLGLAGILLSRRWSRAQD